MTETDSMIGKLIDERYLLHEILGEGGMGAVYRASHVLMDKPVAIKLIHSTIAHMPEVIKRFEREAQSASRLSDPHCITVTDFGRTDDGTLYLVMELLKGEDLSDRLERVGALYPPKAISITKQILQGLAHAHEAGVVHRDLKPENVMLVDHGDVADFAKVFDFGIAKLATEAEGGEKLTQSGMVMGTPAYLSPEQALGDAADHRVDLYAVGVMLYEMLAGVTPYHGSSAMDILTSHLTSPIPSLPEGGHFPSGLQRIVERAMAKKPQDRFSSATDFLYALEALDTTKVSIIGRPASRLARLTPKQKLMFAGAAVCMTMFLGLGLFSTIISDDSESIQISSGKDTTTSDGDTPIEVVESPGVDQDKIKDLLNQADTQIRNGLTKEAVITAKEVLRLSSEQTAGHLLLGHAEFLSGNRITAMKSYKNALEADKTLIEDVRLSEYLEEALRNTTAQKEAAELLAFFGGKKGIDFLTSRANSVSASISERIATRQALIESKNDSSIDWVISLTADFNQAKSCKKKKTVVAQMVSTKNKAFIPLLEANKPVLSRRPFKRVIKNKCIGPIALKAIEKLNNPEETE